MPRECAVVLLLAVPVAAQDAWKLGRYLSGRTTAMTYDLRRERVVLFGGQKSAERTDETWEWDGAWERRSPVHRPPAREGHALCFDPARDVAVLFGGQAGPQHLQDTWEWDGNDWRQSQASGPAARTKCAMAFDPIAVRVALFGGDNPSGSLGDHWHFDGTSWVQLQPASLPPPRSGHAMATDWARGRIVLFGGFTTTASDDTWEWDGSAWTQLQPATHPSARTGHRLAFDEARQRTVLFGGLLSPPASSGALDDTWEWDGATWTRWSTTSPPGARYRHGMAYHRTRQQLVVFGGLVNYEPSMTWTARGTAWTPEPGIVPPHSNYGCAVYDRLRGRVVVAAPDAGNATGFYEWDGRTWTREVRATQPTVTIGCRMVYDSVRQRTVLFGGSGYALSNLWEWDGNAWAQTPIPGIRPSDRWAHGLAYDESRRRVVLFGGATTSGYTDGSTWEYDGVYWIHPTPSVAPSGRIPSAMMAYDPIHARTVLFSGEVSIGLPSPRDTWLWDGTAWSRITAPQPPARAEGAMTFDPIRGRIVLHGGYDPIARTMFSDTWDFDGALWTQRPQSAAAPVVALHDFVFAENRGELMLIGGHRADVPFGFFNDIWFYGPSVPAASVAFGQGCGGLFSPQLRSRDPWLGSRAMTFDVSPMPANGPAVIAIATANLPTPLGSGCTLELGGTVSSQFVLASPLGLARLAITIPEVASLRGTLFFAQAAALDPQGPLGGVSLTNGLRLTAGD